jgi:hypothetical protein
MSQATTAATTRGSRPLKEFIWASGWEVNARRIY